MNEGAYEPRLCNEAKCFKCAVRTQALSLWNLQAGASLGSVLGNNSLRNQGHRVGWTRLTVMHLAVASAGHLGHSGHWMDFHLLKYRQGGWASLSPYLLLHRLGETLNEAARFCVGNFQRKLRYKPLVSNMPSSWVGKSRNCKRIWATMMHHTGGEIKCHNKRQKFRIGFWGQPLWWSRKQSEKNVCSEPFSLYEAAALRTVCHMQWRQH